MGDVRFDGRVAVVTGAGGGLGREYAWLLAERGAKVVVNDVAMSDASSGRPAAAEVVAEEIRSAGGEALAETTSVGTAAARSIVGAALERWGRIDIVINNAGNLRPALPLADTSDEDFEAILDVHLRGPFYIVRAAWPVMVGRGFGRILNTSSASVFGEGESRIAYPTAKAALIGMTRNLGAAGRAHGIAVNALMPLAFTQRLSALREPLLSWIRDNFPPIKVAPLAVFLVHEDVSCSGEIFSAGGGRFARVFFGETSGVCGDPLTLELVRSQFDAAMDPTGSIPITSTFAQLQRYASSLGVTWAHGAVDLPGAPEEPSTDTPDAGRAVR
jgi:NAD(P)-dependent dehydrogenase (short-subunit alcohol dehydrogenase family)